MEIRIFNVEHGFCAYVIANSGSVILIDAGHNSTTGFRPSSYLPQNNCTGIEYFIVSNYDDDHLSDLPNILRLGSRLPIVNLVRNTIVTPEALRKMKQKTGGPGPGLQALLKMIETPPPVVSVDFAGIELVHFRNHYPAFQDTNNLSLVTFLHCGDIHIVFPGDLECSGWEALLKHEQFRQHLGRVNLFVASHHGRDNGFCKDVFAYCQPDLVIVSDVSKQFATQEFDYSPHARGLRFTPNGIRRVLTTRNDGMITIEQRSGNGRRILTSR